MKTSGEEEKKYLVAPTNNLSNFIQAEVNLEKLPFFLPNKKGTHKTDTMVIKYTIEKMQNGTVIKLNWKVSANVELGMPNHFDRDVYRCLQKIATDNGITNQGYITFSYTEIAILLGYNDSGQTLRKIKESLKRLTATIIESEGAFYYKGKKEWLNHTFSLFDNIIERGEVFNDGTTAEKNYIKINDVILESMTSGYLKPVDFDYYISLVNPTSKALYSKLSIDFHGLPDDVSCLTKKYSELCKETLITYQKYPSQAKNYLKKALDELISTKFLAKVEFKPVYKDPHDFYISFYPGERAKDQYKFRNVLLPEIEVFEPLQQLRMVENKKAKPIHEFKSTIINEVVEAVKDQLSEEDLFLIDSLIKLGMSEDKSKECVTKHKEKTIYWLKAKDHYKKSKTIHNLPGFLYTGITSNWQSTPYEEYLNREANKKQHQEEVIKKKEDDKKINETANQEWQQWEPVVTFIENLDTTIKQDLYHLVRQANQGNPFVNKININEKLTALRLTQFKDSFFNGFQALDIDISVFQQLF